MQASSVSLLVSGVAGAAMTGSAVVVFVAFRGGRVVLVVAALAVEVIGQRRSKFNLFKALT